MRVLHGGVFVRVLPPAAQEPPRGEQALDAHRPARVDAAGGDAHLRAEAHAEPVREARRAVVEHARAVHSPQKLRRGARVVRDDAVGVRRAVGVNVVDRRVQVVHHLHRHRRAPVLVPQRRTGRERQRLRRALPTEQLYARLQHRGLDPGVPGAARHVRRVHQQRLERVARGGVVRLAVHCEAARHVQVSLFVEVHVAHAVRVAQHGDLGVVLDVGHEVVAAARDHQVHHVAQLQDVAHRFAALDEHDALARNAEPREALHDDPVKHGVGVLCLLATFQQQAVARADGEARDLRQRVRPGLEDDEEHAERRGDLLEVEPIRDLHLAQGARDGLRHGRDLPRALRELRDLPGLHLQAVHQVGLGVRRLRGLHVLCVGRHDSGLVRLERIRDGAQELGALLAGQVLKLAARRPGGDRLVAGGRHRAGHDTGGRARRARETAGRRRRDETNLGEADWIIFYSTQGSITPGCRSGALPRRLPFGNRTQC